MNAILVLPKYAIDINDPCVWPLGFMYVSSYIKRAWKDVQVLNFNIDSDWHLETEFDGKDIVMLTGGEEFLPEIKRISGIAKSMGIQTTLGGSLATFKTKEMKKYVDVVFRGELGAHTPIDDLPWPDYEGFGIEEYHKRHSIRYMGILASRGCPYSCTFCANVCRYRERDPKAVALEIDHYIKKYRIEMLVFNDNTLNVTKDRFMNICEIIKPRHLSWGAAIRADVFDEEMAVAFKKSGGQYFVIGIESFRQERLDKMNKKLKVDQLKSTLDLLHKKGIGYHGNIILGINGESLDDIVSEVEELPKGYNLFPVLAQPFPGTRILSSLPKDQRDHLNHIFAEYALQRGKSVYPLS